MSGTEEAVNQFTSLNNILTMIVTISLIVTAIAALIRYLRSTVSSKVDNFRREMKLDFETLAHKIEYQDKETTQRSMQNEQNIQQMKWMVEQMQKTVSDQVTSVREDIERLEERRFKDVQMVRDRIIRLENKIMNGGSSSNSDTSSHSEDNKGSPIK